MRIHLLKLTITLSLGVLFAIYSLNGSAVSAFSSGPPAGRTGAPALGSSPAEPNCTICHAGTVNSGGGTFTITAPANYSPGQDVTVTVNISQANRPLFGFQLTALNDQGQKTGDLVASSDGRTAVPPGGARQYIQHTFNGTAPTAAGQNSWTFTWKAPAQSAGRVTFYAAGNAANGSGTSGGDSIYTTSKSIDPASTLSALATVSAASFAPQPNPLAANQIVAGFGSGLAQNTTSATPGMALPPVLDGTSISVRDANGMARDAGLFFVSTGQVNYLIPPMTANGAATITLRRNGVDTAQGTATIETIAPGIFTANSSGSGLPAAVLFRRRGMVDTFEPISPEIDLGPDGDIVFLIAFGTGIRGLSSLMGASATIGGVNARVDAVLPAPGFEGLEQINIFIPRTLMGRGLVDVVFTADNKPANTVQLRFK